MDTPIKDFVDNYAKENKLRLHMPGHKGKTFLGLENVDLTEVDGADCLYSANGIIKQSQDNASQIFDAHTFYSTEGSSLSIRAMIYLAYKNCKNKKNAYILAGRNAHKSFISAVGLLGVDVKWLLGNDSYLSCTITPDVIEKELSTVSLLPFAVYITTPDYLGNTLDVFNISKVCKKYGVLLLVDNAHGSYLNFLTPNLHPISLGADLCADSAHKTLPALTGASYLHLSKNLPPNFIDGAKSALSIFASTSPSYLILQSLDNLNHYLVDGYKQKLHDFIDKIEILKKELTSNGYTLLGNEPLKITISTKAYGYTGQEINEILNENNIVVEFYDNDFVVLMLTPELSENDLSKLKDALLSIEKRQKIECAPPNVYLPKKVLSIRDALLMPTKKLPTTLCHGKILGSLTVSCPPAVSIVVCGERIDDKAIQSLLYHSIDFLEVIDE